MTDESHDPDGNMPAGAAPDEVIYDPANPDRRPAWADRAIEDMERAGIIRRDGADGPAEDDPSMQELGDLVRSLADAISPGDQGCCHLVEEAVAAGIKARLEDDEIREAIRGAIARHLTPERMGAVVDEWFGRFNWPEAKHCPDPDRASPEGGPPR